MTRPHDYGARREFLVIGNALLRAAEALDEAPVGTLVVSKVAWPQVGGWRQGGGEEGW